jgi:hypothetical protein
MVGAGVGRIVMPEQLGLTGGQTLGVDRAEIALFGEPLT